MNNVFKRTTFYAAIIATTAMSPLAMATNGYFADGYGTKNKGLVGGGVAAPQDAMIAATNPAGMVFVGERMDLGLAVFSPSPRSYSASADSFSQPDGPCGGPCPFTIGGFGGSQSIESDNDYFLIPHFAYNWMLNTDSSVGVTVYGNGGMNTEYQGGQAQYDNGAGTGVTTPGTFGAGTAGVNLEQLFINASYARKFGAASSWGVSAILAYQRFEAKGLNTFQGYSLYGSDLSDNGTDTSYGFGVKLGIQSEVAPGFKLAASYQSKMDMSEFDKYRGLFAENGDFDIPETWTVGLAWNMAPKMMLTFDVQQINYSGVAAVANSITALQTNCTPGAPATGAGCLGGSDGAGFGWDDMTIYKLGFQWETSSTWTWRAGYSHGEQPIPEGEVLFNILAPAVIEDHVSFGFTNNMSPTSELNFVFTHALNNSVTGANAFNPSQNITLEMSQNEAEVSWAWKF